MKEDRQRQVARGLGWFCLGMSILLLLLHLLRAGREVALLVVALSTLVVGMVLLAAARSRP
jgi:hypothetical protein